MPLFPAGRYHIRPLKNASNESIEPVCGSLLTTATVPIGEDFDYVFDLISDCNLNGVDDAIDILADSTLDIYPVHEEGGQIVLGNGKIDSCEDCSAYSDVTLDGNYDQGDVDCMVAVISGDPSCSPWPLSALDVNQDGNWDQADVDTIINWVAGDCTR